MPCTWESRGVGTDYVTVRFMLCSALGFGIVLPLDRTVLVQSCMAALAMAAVLLAMAAVLLAMAAVQGGTSRYCSNSRHQWNTILDLLNTSSTFLLVWCT